MSVYRKWSVFLALQALTIVWWSDPGLFPGGLLGWNYIWSDLAIIVEMMVGIAFLNQSMRDARIIREELAQIKLDSELIRDIHEALCPGGDMSLVAVPGPDGHRVDRLEIRETA